MKRLNILLLALTLTWVMPTAWAEDDKEKKEDVALPTPGYLALNSVVVNLSTGAKHARFEAQLMIHNKDQLGDIKTHQAAVTNELLMLVSDEDGAVLKTPKGKETFRQKALDACNQVLKDLTGIERPLRDIFFTTFFVQ